MLLFTAAVFWRNECETYVICSDTKNKDKNTIFAFLDFFYSEMIKESHEVSEEIIWNDVPSSELKNKFMVETLKRLSEKYSKTFTWKYSATSHGRGVVGGSIKRLVRMKMMAQGDGCTIQCPKDFAEVAPQFETKTQVWYIEEDYIEQIILSENPWENVLPIPGIN